MYITRKMCVWHNRINIYQQSLIKILSLADNRVTLWTFCGYGLFVLWVWPMILLFIYQSLLLSSHSSSVIMLLFFVSNVFCFNLLDLSSCALLPGLLYGVWFSCFVAELCFLFSLSLICFTCPLPPCLFVPVYIALTSVQSLLLFVKCSWFSPCSFCLIVWINLLV